MNWEENQADLGYGQLFKIFWRRRLMFLAVSLGTFALSIPFILQKEPIYKSYMQLLVEPNYQGHLVLDEELPGAQIEIDYATQINLMRSSELLKRAIDRLQLKYPDLNFGDLKQSFSLVQLIEGDKTQTKIFQAVYEDGDSQKTKDVLEAIKEVYLQYNLELQQIRFKEGLSFIEAQIPEARQNLIQVEAQLKKLRTQYNLIAPEQQATYIAGALNNVEQERETLKARSREIKSHYDELQKQFGISNQNTKIAPPLSQSSTYQQLYDQLQATETELEEQRTRFTDANPVIQDLINKRDSKKAQLQQEADKILASASLSKEQLTPSQQEGEFRDSDTELIGSIAKARADLAGIEERDRALAITQNKLEQQLDRVPEIITRYNNLVQEVEVRRETLERLLTAKQELSIEIDRGGFNWQVVEPPQLGQQIGPDTPKDILLSLVVASFLGGISVFIRDSLDDRLYESKQIEDRISLPILGATPGLGKNRENPFLWKLSFPTSETASITDILGWQAFRESLDLIYENLQMLDFDAPFRSLAITSAIAGEGKSTLVLGLALSVARRQQRVLVIDANLRDSSLHQKLNLPNDLGLTNILSGETTAPNIHQVPILGENIDVLTAGSETMDPFKLISTDTLQKLINSFEKLYDLVLIDTPPAIGMVDAIKTASCCSGTVMVVRIERSEISKLVEATRLLDKLNVLGVVANDSKEITNDSKEITKKSIAQKPYLLPEAVS